MGVDDAPEGCVEQSLEQSLRDSNILGSGRGNKGDNRAPGADGEAWRGGAGWSPTGKAGRSSVNSIQGCQEVK